MVTPSGTSLSRFCLTLVSAAFCARFPHQSSRMWAVLCHTQDSEVPPGMEWNSWCSNHLGNWELQPLPHKPSIYPLCSSIMPQCISLFLETIFWEKRQPRGTLSGQILLLLASSVMERIFKNVNNLVHLYKKVNIRKCLSPCVSSTRNIMFYPGSVLSVTPMQAINEYRLK